MSIDITTGTKLLALAIVGLTVLTALVLSAVFIATGRDIPNVVYIVDFTALMQALTILGVHVGSGISNGAKTNGNGAANVH